MVLPVSTWCFMLQNGAVCALAAGSSEQPDDSLIA
jgi:hypothetical protein